MTKEEIIATAIHEAFRCGKEAGEESQRMWHSMQQKIDAAKQGNLDHDQHQYDGVMPVIELAKLKEENDKLGKILEEYDDTITKLRDSLDERHKDLRALDNDHSDLLRLIKEKDATITELREELRLYTEKATVHDGSPTGESPHTITTFHEGDQVVISRAFFDEKEGPDLHGIILSVLDDSCVVVIDEEYSIYDDVEFVIVNEFITKA